MSKSSWPGDFPFEGAIKEVELCLPAVEMTLEDVRTIEERWPQPCGNERRLGVFVACDDSVLMCRSCRVLT